MKYWELFTEDQKSTILDFLDEIGADFNYLEYDMEEINYCGYTIVVGDDIYYIIKDNKVIDVTPILDYDCERIFVSINDKYKLIFFSIRTTEGNDEDAYIFDCNDETYLTCRYVSSISY